MAVVCICRFSVLDLGKLLYVCLYLFKVVYETLVNITVDQITFTIKILSLVYNFKILQYFTKNCIIKIVGKVKIIKAPMRIELMTCSFHSKPALTHCTTPLC